MNKKSRGLVYILIGTIFFVIGLALVYEELITLGVIIIAIAGVPIFTGFSVLFNDDSPQSQSEAEEEVKKEHTIPPLGSLLAAIDLTIMALDEAFDKKSKHIYKKVTAKLDYSIYLFFKNYCILCNTQNETLVTYYIQFALDRLKEHFSSKMSENKIDRIIDERISEYDRIVQTSDNFVEEITYAIEQHLIKDLYCQNAKNESIAIAGEDTHFEINLELFVLNDYISYKINPIYDNLISEWNSKSSCK